MSENLQSPWAAPALLLPLLAAALVLALARPPRRDDEGRRQLVEIFLIGIGCQCAHFFEEYITGIYVLYPALLGLAPAPAELFVGLNVLWLGIWVISAMGVLRGAAAAYFPVWFFGLAMCLNGILHPLLALWVGGYFPGLFTSPVAGLIGVLVTRKLFQLTGTAGA